jgi:hypothetical protein
MPTETSYKRSYKVAIDELTELMEQYEELENQMEALRGRISTVRRGVVGLAGLCGAVPGKEYPHLFPHNISKDAGFTDAIREVLKSKGRYSGFTPVGVRDALKAAGFDLGKYKNPLASIHTILKRLEIKGEAKGITQDDGSILYVWQIWPDGDGDDLIPF